MSDGGIVTAEVNGFTVDSNTAGTKEKLQENLRVKPSEEVSKAGSELGKLGGKAAAEKRAEAKATEDEPERKPIKPIPPKDKAPDKPEAVIEAKSKEEKVEEADIPEDKAEEKPHLTAEQRSRATERVAEATRKAREARLALEAERQSKQALEARLEALERRQAPTEPSEKPAPRPDGKPRLEDFVKDAETYEEAQEAYLEARDAWRDRQNQQKREEEAIVSALDSQVGKFREAASKHMDSYSVEVLSLKTEFQLPPGEQPTGANWIANELVFSPGTAPSLMLYLSEHPDELQRIAALQTPRAVSREMAKLETRLESATPGNSATNRDDDVSRAAPPVKPVTGKPYVTEDGYRPGMDLDEYVRMRKRQAKSAR